MKSGAETGRHGEKLVPNEAGCQGENVPLRLLFLLRPGSGLSREPVMPAARGLGVRTFLNFCRSTITRALCRGSWGVRGLLRERRGVPPGDLKQSNTPRLIIRVYYM